MFERKSELEGKCVFMATFVPGPRDPVRRRRHLRQVLRKVFGPDDRETPAYSKQDGVDYVPMRGWKNSLINLLNIAGTGPIFGTHSRASSSGPSHFITIPSATSSAALCTTISPA